MKTLAAIPALLLAALAVAGTLSDAQIQALYAKPDPFESVPHERWIAESPNAFAIRDKNPQAPIHILVISKARIPTMLEADPALLGEMLARAQSGGTRRYCTRWLPCRH